MNEGETINRGAKFGGEDRLLRREEYVGKRSRRREIGRKNEEEEEREN